MRKTIRKLALTYRDELVDRVGWLIRLRWATAFGVSSTILMVSSLFELLIDGRTLLLIASSIFLCNAVYQVYLKWLLARRKMPHWHRRVAFFANLQISADLVILIFLIYFSGGAENPFYFYFIFHMIIASILLSTAASYLQATLAVILFNLMLCLEGAGVIPHHRLFPFFEEAIYGHPLFLVGLSSVFTSTIFLSVYMATSITSRLRQREEELVQLKNSLEQANLVLRQVHEHRTRFTLKVEHELKAPLAAIQSLIVVILTSFARDIPEKVKDLLTRAEKRTHILLEMIRELLELSRMQSAGHRFEMQPLELEPLLSRQIEILRSQAEDRSLTLVKKYSDGLPRVSGDPKAVEQVIMNLLSNAIKYTESGGIEVEATPQGRFVRLSVSDTGIGMQPEELERVFEEFYRGERAKEKYEGTGLGLSIVKEIVEGHGGKIELESAPGKGTRISVLLPAAGTRD